MAAIAYPRALKTMLQCRAIACDSFKVLAKKAWTELSGNRKKGPKTLFFYLW